MNVHQINYVIAVSVFRNFGQAAEKCFVTQSTLSTMVARFEDEIGVKIFDRKTKPVTITREGEAVITQLKFISREIQALDEVVQVLKGELTGTIKMGVIPTVAPFLLPRFLNDFAMKFPNLNFEVSERNTAAIKDLLQKRELDIGIAAIPLEEPDLEEISLYNESFVLYNCQPKQLPDKVTINDLDFDRFWLLEEGHCLRTQVQRICDYDACKNQENINFEFKAGSIDSLVRFVKMNGGMTLLPQLAVHDLTESEKEKVRRFEAPVPVRTIGIVVHRHFVKKQILSLLQREIKDKIVPLLVADRNEQVVHPV